MNYYVEIDYYIKRENKETYLIDQFDNFIILINHYILLNQNITFKIQSFYYEVQFIYRRITYKNHEYIIINIVYLL